MLSFCVFTFIVLILEMNGVKVECTDKDIIEAGLKIACGEMEYNGLVGWIKNHEVGYENTF